MSEQHNPEDLFEFPCDYQFKAVGVSGDEFKYAVVAAISELTSVSGDAVRCRPSGKGKYQSVSVMVMLHNFDQLKSIYAGLKQIPGLKMLL